VLFLLLNIRLAGKHKDQICGYIRYPDNKFLQLSV